MRFQPGQKVRCVKQGPWKLYDCTPIRGGPKFGGVYLVEAVEVWPHPQTGQPYEWLALAGLRDSRCFAPVWGSEHFRALEGDEFERLREVCAAAGQPARVSEPA